MKIFNWVHKTFHHSAVKDGFASSNMKKYDPNVIKWDSQALLKEVALADVVGGWKDGILTIGTLGCYEPLKSFNDHKDYLALESDEVEEDEGDQEENYSADGYEYEEENKYYYSSEHDEEMNPLIHSSFEKQSFEDVVNDKSDDDNASKEEVFGTLNALPVVSYEVTESNHVVTDQKKKKGERITLADLFLADSEKIMKQKDSAKVLIDQPSEKPSLKAKHGLPTLAKKLIPRVNKDNARPLKNIQKLMKKMIKKKIHPELDVKNQNPEGQKVGASCGIFENQKIEANDSITMLLF